MRMMIRLNRKQWTVSMYDELLRKINELSEHVKRLESRNVELKGRLSRSAVQSTSDESLNVANVGYIINKESIAPPPPYGPVNTDLCSAYFTIYRELMAIIRSFWLWFDTVRFGDRSIAISICEVTLLDFN